MSVAAEGGCMGHSSRPDVRVAQQRVNVQLTYSQTPMCTHLVKASYITIDPDDRTVHSQDAHQWRVLLRVEVHVTLPTNP